MPGGRAPNSTNVYGVMPPVATNWMLNGAPAIALLRAPVVRVNLAGETAREKSRESNTPLISTACTVNLDVPKAVGVPLREPLGFRVRPAGRVPPMSVNVYGVAPPVAAKLSAYGVPTPPAGRIGKVVICTLAGGLETVRTNCEAVWLFRESLTLTEMMELAAVVAVPEKPPVLLSNKIPGGKLDAAQV